MTDSELQAFAKIGAQVRIDQLRAEMNAIMAAFPDLLQHDVAPPVRAVPSVAHEVSAPRRRRRLTADERKAISRRMKRYWRQRSDK